MNKQDYYKAHLTRDPRFDGKFFVAVKTTKIYCRPICPARKAKLENLEFFHHAVLAEQAGYRPCLRCRPESAPGSLAWIGISAIIKRAIRIMESSELENLSINALATKLAVSERWLREVFQREIGISPQQLLLDKKLAIAKNLLEHSMQSITDIAFCAGFNSIRRFNDAFKTKFQQTPNQVRKNTAKSTMQSIRLRYRPPFNWKKILAYFQQRTIPCVETVSDNSYERLFTLHDCQGWMKASQIAGNQLQIQFILNQPTHILDMVSRIKTLFDLDADPMLIEKDLAKDKALKPLLKHYPGLRIPGCWDGFELAVRAIIGQKISVKAARIVLIRLVELCGEKQTFDQSLALTHFFPTPENIIKTDLSNIGLTQSKINSIKSLASLIQNSQLKLDGTADEAETIKTLLSIKGIGPWTTEYIALRALKNPNAFPENDLEIQKRLKQFHLDPTQWIPWRAYGTVLLLNLD